MELDSVDAISRVLSKDKDALITEVQLLVANLSEKDDLINKLRNDLVEKSKQMSEALAVASKQLFEVKSEGVKELELLAQTKANVIADNLRTIDELQREINKMIAENNDERNKYQLQLSANKTASEELNEQFVSVRKALQDEKTEAAALRLRLKLYESNQQQPQPQPQNLQLRLPQRRIHQSQEPEHQSNLYLQRQQVQENQFKGEDDEDDEGLENPINRRGNKFLPFHLFDTVHNHFNTEFNHRTQLLSPAFSEDLGPASFSSSILLMPLSPPQSPRQTTRNNQLTMSSSDSPVGFAGIASQASYNRDRNVAVRKRQDFDNDREKDERNIQQDARHVEDKRVTALLEENDRLKKVVREVSSIKSLLSYFRKHIS